MPLEMADAAAMAKELRTLLRQALPRPSSPLPLTLQGQVIPAVSDKARIQLTSMGIRLGDRVVIAGQKVCFHVADEGKETIFFFFFSLMEKSCLEVSQAVLDQIHPCYICLS